MGLYQRQLSSSGHDYRVAVEGGKIFPLPRVNHPAELGSSAGLQNADALG
jgi:hypothetical protein